MGFTYTCCVKLYAHSYLPTRTVGTPLGVGVRFADYIYFLKYPMKMKKNGLNETELFHF